jgi:hypothetical protein
MKNLKEKVLRKKDGGLLSDSFRKFGETKSTNIIYEEEFTR